MAELERIDFEERDRMWIVTLTDADGQAVPGEPFPTSGHENFTKLEQVLRRVQELGYRPSRVPYDRVNERRYVFEVTAL